MTITMGRIAYRNVLPVYHALENGTISHDMRMVYGPPAELNRRMEAGEIDIGSCSSVAYARHPERYLLVPGMAIGSRGPVQSVLLLSRRPAGELDGQTILVSAETHTSATLLKLLLAEHLRINCAFHTDHATKILDSGQRPEGILAIGDEALRLRTHPDYPFRLDLGAAWTNWTGLPFVFGVWAVSRRSAAEKPREIAAAIRLLHQSMDMGLSNLDAICALAAPGSGLSETEMHAYFNGLVLRMGPGELDGLRLYYDKLFDFGWTDARIPVAFFAETPQKNAASCP